jgi:Spy/CpxP family protein refolding chaperone
LLRSERQRHSGGAPNEGERGAAVAATAAAAAAAVAAVAAVAAAAADAAAAEVEEKVKVENSEGAGGLKVAGQSLTLFLCSY